MAEEKKLSPKKNDDAEMLEKLKVLQKMEVLEMMRDLKMLEKGPPKADKKVSK